jgi:hypothetical protein
MGAFFGLQQARIQSEDAYRLISEFPDEEVHEKERSLAKLAAYNGYAHILLGEGFCEMTLDGGPRMSPNEVLDIARQEFWNIGLSHPEGMYGIIKNRLRNVQNPMIDDWPWQTPGPTNIQQYFIQE